MFLWKFRTLHTFVYGILMLWVSKQNKESCKCLTAAQIFNSLLTRFFDLNQLLITHERKNMVVKLFYLLKCEQMKLN